MIIVLLDSGFDATDDSRLLSVQKKYMKQVAFVLSFILLILTFAGCKKDLNGSESVLYGVWVKGSNFGDTLWFMQKNGKNIMRMADSFNAGTPVYSEKEYRFRNGVPEIKLFSPSPDDYYPISSFKWIQQGSKFSLKGFQLYFFMSSTMTEFTYQKI
jgi:hypothetical protein